MELNEMIKLTIKHYNCCDRRATNIIAKYINEGKENELINLITTM